MTSFAAELRAGGPAWTCRRGLWLTFLSPFGLELAAACGAEWIAIDVQHGDLDLTDVAPLARVSPVPVLVRLASHDEAQLARVLDAGVDGVIVPAVESAAQAGQLVQAACFPPRGRRSKGLARASLRRCRRGTRSRRCRWRLGAAADLVAAGWPGGAAMSRFG